MKLYASGEDYLEAILVLQQKQGMVRSVDVARHMEVSKPQCVPCGQYSERRRFPRDGRGPFSPFNRYRPRGC